MLTIDIKKKNLKVAVKGKDPLIDGELHQAVKRTTAFGQSVLTFFLSL